MICFFRGWGGFCGAFCGVSQVVWDQSICNGGDRTTLIRPTFNNHTTSILFDGSSMGFSMTPRIYYNWESVKKSKWKIWKFVFMISRPNIIFKLILNCVLCLWFQCLILSSNWFWTMFSVYDLYAKYYLQFMLWFFAQNCSQFQFIKCVMSNQFSIL